MACWPVLGMPCSLHTYLYLGVRRLRGLSAMTEAFLILTAALFVPLVVLGGVVFLRHEWHLDRWWNDKPDKAWRKGKGPPDNA